MTPATPVPQQPLPYVKDDFVSDQDVRWCPGCGDYAILSVMQRTLAKFSIPRENYVFVSGIGCSSRFPYYMNTYGFHTIHGRAPTIASGLKCVNNDLSIFVITGDGDGLSIGGNHLIHALRRNLDINIILVNNEIYGLTKGQYSPTSKQGKVSKSTPMGSIDHPINPLCVAIASQASFVARTLDTDPKHMAYVLERAIKHRGTTFVEIYQNCLIFNDKTYGPVTGREHRADRMLYLEDGKPLIFGAKKDKAIKLQGLQPQIVSLADVKDEKELLHHNENDPEPNYAYFLTQMEYPEMPVPFGVLRYHERPTYNELLNKQTEEALKKKGKGVLKDLVYGSDTWTVKEHVRSYRSVPALKTQEIAEPKKAEKMQKIMMEAPVSAILSDEQPLLVKGTDSIQHVVELFSKYGRDCVLVMKKSKLVGILSQRDILHRVAGKHKEFDKLTVESVMTLNPEFVKPEAPIAFAVNKMAVGGFRHVPVISHDGTPITIMTIRDVLCYLDKRD